MVNEVNKQLINICAKVFVEESKSDISFIEMQIKCYETEKERLLSKRPYKFQKKKLKEFNEKLNKIDEKILSFYEKLGKEYEVIEDLNKIS